MTEDDKDHADRIKRLEAELDAITERENERIKEKLTHLKERLNRKQKFNPGTPRR